MQSVVLFGRHKSILCVLVGNVEYYNGLPQIKQCSFIICLQIRTVGKCNNDMNRETAV